MIRHRPDDKPEKVRLSAGNWITILSIAITVTALIIERMWTFSVSVRSDVAALNQRVESLERQVGARQLTTLRPDD